MSFEILQSGLVPYSEAEERQRTLAALRRSGRIGDTLWLLEHPPVLTMGRRDSIDDLLVPPEELRQRGIELAKTDRGGRMTYHGPGQLVGYLIVQLGGRGISEFVRTVEELLICLLASYGLTGERDSQYPGIWINQTTRPEGPLRGGPSRQSGGMSRRGREGGWLHPRLGGVEETSPLVGGTLPSIGRDVLEGQGGRMDVPKGQEGRAATQAPMKIAALGLHVERGVTRHGFALNVNCDLKPFGYIHPCGIKNRRVTSMKEELKWDPSIKEVKRRLILSLNSALGGQT